MRATAVWLERGIRWLLLATSLTPLIVKMNVFFPFAFGKALFLRSLIEVVLVLVLMRLLLAMFGDAPFSPAIRVRRLLTHPIVLALGVFFVSLTVSTAAALNQYRAFWGDLERVEGWFGMVHFFLLLLFSLLFFRKKDWLWYFGLSLGVGAILMYYAVLEYAGVRNFPFAVAPSRRPGSLIGNAAFLATHMIFLLTYAGIVFAIWRPGKGGKMTLAIFAVLAAALIFLTGTRGAILALGAGLFLLLLGGAWGKLRPQHPAYAARVRKGALGVLVALLAFGGIFWATRGAHVWQSIPGLDRLAQTAALNRKDPSTQTRLITWKVSWQAFKEKPMLGWGLENYLVAYEKHYDPDYAVYGETWLDRAHNKIFDLLVMQGAFGLLAYVLLFCAVVFVLIRRKVPAAWAIGAGLFAYFLQNLLLFDQIVSYTTFFMLLGFIVASSLAEDTAMEARASALSSWLAWPLGVLLLGGVFGVPYVLYAFTYVPYRQNEAFRESAGVGRVDLAVAKLKFATHPYNYAQYNIRGQGVDVVYLNQYFYNEAYRENPAFKEVGTVLLDAMDEVRKKEPFDVRVFVREAEMLDGYGKQHPEVYPRIEAILREALLLAPKRQELYYHLAVNVAKQGRLEEGLALAKTALDMSPDVPRANFHYAVLLEANGRKEEAIAALERLEALDPTFSTLLGGDHNSIMLLYESWGRYDKIEELAWKSVQGVVAARFNPSYYKMALQIYAARRDREKFIATARFLAAYAPGEKDDMETLIDLAEKGLWDVIGKL